MNNTISIKKYRCPKDATPSEKMTIISKGRNGLRNRDFPNEVLFCSTCNKLYRWKQLRELGILHYEI